MRKVITMEQALNSAAGRRAAAPLRLLADQRRRGGGPADARSIARAISPSKPVRILGVAQASDFVALDQKQDITTFPAVRRASQKAYEMAGVGPQDIQFAELHDCFTIAEIVALEDLGFVERGSGRTLRSLRRHRPHRREAHQRQRRPEIQGPSRGRHRRRTNLRHRGPDPLRSRRPATETAFARLGAESGRFGRFVRSEHSRQRMRSVRRVAASPCRRVGDRALQARERS